MDRSSRVAPPLGAIEEVVGHHRRAGTAAAPSTLESRHTKTGPGQGREPLSCDHRLYQVYVLGDDLLREQQLLAFSQKSGF